MHLDGLNCIAPKAQIGENVSIGPFVTIEEDVVIGDGCKIMAGAHILNGTRMGKDCEIYQGAIIGTAPQTRRKYEKGILEIGDRVIIREYCTINCGTKTNNYKTIIENDCMLMAYVHVAHDCILREFCILANSVNIAGHVEVGKYAILGGLVAVHQFATIGESVMVGGGSLVRKDVPPYIKASREPLSYIGINSIGLKRRDFSQDKLNHIGDIYRILFMNKMNTTQAMTEIRQTIDATPERERILSFIENTKRGLIRGYRYLRC